MSNLYTSEVVNKCVEISKVATLKTWTDVLCAREFVVFQYNEMIDTLRTFILLYAYGWFKKNSERSVYMNSRMLSLMLHTAIKVTIIAGIVHVSMITAMFLTFITIK